ncbi:DMT family transporter [Parendozoicomonas haliclonae]|uniref:Putative DMT superfamily transporter inner membrane protein n=1 Tax=Parendozoicomonas haliclonae TaxID=1960125 RepID=A0A1X7AT56_9GAMM|nr:DMT family transporter [Parendozoicomonas haliclonae]SMA50577.1 putative DMT superfamily transporter inner membrane protein [Parendozoicomonas haliclonae]
MNQRTFLADGLLMLAALIWGTAFVAQRIGMDHMEPWGFNAVRFLIGSVALLPLLWVQYKKGAVFYRGTWLGGIAMGVTLMFAAGLQQAGLVYTTAGKAAFITGLYIVIVPLLSLLLGSQTNRDTWLGITIALPGLAMLTLGDHVAVNIGDYMMIACSLFWAIHLLLIDRLAQRHNVIALAFIQFLTCSLLSFGVAGVTETLTYEQIELTLWPLLYVGILSTGVAYTLQIIGQKKTPAAHASIILSLETVFAVIAGYLFLNEVLSAQAMVGCLLMLTGMLVSQLGVRRIRKLVYNRA